MAKPSPTTPERVAIGTFTSRQWSGRPIADAFPVFMGSGFLGLILCLLLMIFIPGLRSFGATMAFTLIAAITLTTYAFVEQVSSEKRFLHNLTARVNEAIVLLAANPKNRLSPKGMRWLIESGKREPLLLNGVPGLDLSVVRKHEVKGKNETLTTSTIIITVTPPAYGIESFDKLLAAAVDGETSE